MKAVRICKILNVKCSKSVIRAGCAKLNDHIDRAGSMDNEKISGDATAYLRLATEQSLEITITFLLDKCPVSYLLGRCAMLKKKHFIVSMSQEELNSHPIIGGGEVRCSFTVKKTRPIRCDFGSRLCRTFRGSDDVVYLVFELPSQKSSFARLFNKYSFTAWGAIFSAGDEFSLPALRWLKMESSWCRLAELSASGVRLDIQTRPASVSRLSYQDNILLRGNSRVAQAANPFYLLGQVVRIVPHPSDEQLSYGCIFLAWCDEDMSRQGWVEIEAGKGAGILPSWSLESQFRAFPQ